MSLPIHIESPWDETSDVIDTHQEAEWSRISSDFTNVYCLCLFVVPSYVNEGEARQVIEMESHPERRVLSRKALIQVLQTSGLQLVEK
jgi:hypothetical protein